MEREAALAIETVDMVPQGFVAAPNIADSLPADFQEFDVASAKTLAGRGVRPRAAISPKISPASRRAV